MATSTRISLEEYFRTHYEPECELINGELRPKPMPTGPHSEMQAQLQRLLWPYEQLGQGKVLPELTLLLADESVLIPDLVFRRRGQTYDQNQVLNTPPMLCVEITSPSQSFSELYDN